MEELDEQGFYDISPLLGAGIYALLRFKEVVYIGQAKVLLRRLYTHRNLAERKAKGTLGATPYGIKTIQFSSIWIFPCLASDLHREERRLILMFQPRYNEKLKDSNEIEPPGRGEALLKELGMFKLTFGKIERRY